MFPVRYRVVLTYIEGESEPLKKKCSYYFLLIILTLISELFFRSVFQSYVTIMTLSTVAVPEHLLIPLGAGNPRPEVTKGRVKHLTLPSQHSN